MVLVLSFAGGAAAEGATAMGSIYSTLPGKNYPLITNARTPEL